MGVLKHTVAYAGLRIMMVLTPLKLILYCSLVLTRSPYLDTEVSKRRNTRDHSSHRLLHRHIMLQAAQRNLRLEVILKVKLRAGSATSTTTIFPLSTLPLSLLSMDTVLAEKAVYHSGNGCQLCVLNYLEKVSSLISISL